MTSRSNRRGAALVRSLVVRDFKGQYRRSILGPAWAILQPLGYLVVFTILRGTLELDSEGVPYPLFAFSALVPWTFFANGVTRSTPSIYANGAIVKKMAVLREVFPMAAVSLSFADFLISSVILGGFMVWYGVAPTVAWLWLPVLIGLLTAMALGLGLGLAAIGAYKRDVAFAVPFMLQALLLLSPVAYAIDTENSSDLLRFNPLAGIIDGFREVLVHGQSPDGGLLVISVVGIGLIWAAAVPLFRSMSQYFADVL